MDVKGLYEQAERLIFWDYVPRDEVSLKLPRGEYSEIPGGVGLARMAELLYDFASLIPANPRAETSRLSKIRGKGNLHALVIFNGNGSQILSHCHRFARALNGNSYGRSSRQRRAAASSAGR